MRITKHSEFVDLVSYTLQFAGYAFDCDAKGQVDLEAMPLVARANLQKLLQDHGPGRVVRHERTVREPAEGRCDCGRCVVLDDSWINSCDCGREYNGSGQELAPRAQWGEETGEHPADVARAGADW